MQLMENLQKKIQILLNLYRSKKFQEAEILNKELIKSHKKIPFLYNTLGLILTAQNRVDEAIKIYEKGAKIKPSFAMIYNNLGTIYKAQNNYSKAENLYKKSILIDNNIAEPYNNLGNLHITLNNFKDAIKYYKNAIKVNKKFFISFYNLGTTFMSIGDNKNAKKYLQECLKINPHFCPAHRNLSIITKYNKDHLHFHQLKKLYSQDINYLENKSELEFSLAKAFDDIRDFKNAFVHYKKGNNLRRKDVNFSIKNEKENFEIIKSFFNDEIFKKYISINNFSSKPIFILGMPRSGTTLIEQILSTHKDVHGGGELDFLPKIAEQYLFNDKDKLLNQNIFNKMGLQYLNKINKKTENSKMFTDKLPINFKFIGLIKLILPNATIINCNRNAKDVCFSIYKNYFVNTNLSFAYELKEIVAYYNMYHDMMKHWKQVLPNFVYDLNYENVIKNPEKEVRLILDRCNLSWDPNCLKFYNNKRPIKTASSNQARKKIYTTSINLWKNYEKDLKDIFKDLVN
tara:strand:+ start:1677 stop:3221 length:1545 start_codon:yes stop_codon:yes gene_type:complete